MHISNVFTSPLFPDTQISFLDKYNLIPTTGLTCLAGEAKAGKTLLALQVIVNYLLQSNCKVVWYDLERNSNLKKRLLQIFSHETLLLLRESNFNFETVLENSSLLSDDETFEEMLQNLSEPNTIVVIDSLNQLQARRPVAEYCNIIHSETAFFTTISASINPKSALLLIHHHNKMGGISGTSAVSQCCDCICDMSLEISGGTGICRQERKVISRVGRNVPNLKLYYDLCYPYFSFSEK